MLRKREGQTKQQQETYSIKHNQWFMKLKTKSKNFCYEGKLEKAISRYKKFRSIDKILQRYRLLQKYKISMNS